MKNEVGVEVSYSFQNLFEEGANVSLFEGVCLVLDQFLKISPRIFQS